MKTIFYNSTKAVKLFLSFTIAPKVTKRLALLVFFFFASVSIFGQQSTITISTSATSGGSFTGTAPNKVFTPSASTANIQASALVTELLTNNVTINTALVGGTGTGNVTFNTALTVAPTGTTQRTFTINAGGPGYSDLITITSGVDKPILGNTSITSTLITGNLSNTGGSTTIEKGFIISSNTSIATTERPSTFTGNLSNGNGTIKLLVDTSATTGNFIKTIADISGLTPGKTYYVWAYTYNTCLLYTSPSPRDRQKSRMPSSA